MRSTSGSPVDEALLLADRALVLYGGRIAEKLPVALDHPRAPDDPGFGPLRRQLLDRLGSRSAAEPGHRADREIVRGAQFPLRAAEEGHVHHPAVPPLPEGGSL